MSKLLFENLEDIYQALDGDLITPAQAVTITCKALRMLDIRLDDEPIKKETVLNQLKALDELIESQPETPILFFSQKDNEFNLKQVFDVHN